MERDREGHLLPCFSNLCFATTDQPHGRNPAGQVGPSLEAMACYDSNDETQRSTTRLRSEASTTIQKHWRGHATRNNDERVKELKSEIRQQRMEQHIRHLTKELTSAKGALEQERKLRALQMDALKVMWKELQMMEEARKSREILHHQHHPFRADHPNVQQMSSSYTVSSARTSAGLQNPARPSGWAGSRISSRASEHSISKLMEMLEATAGCTVSKGWFISLMGFTIY